ncbi:hypothetical protein AXZ77_2184 [Thioclava sp. ES.031]|uniref:hypothetical protein n=1 Tax=Thioclava sp. ES.031 TaxID=1798203 RepID=UPI000C016FC4|nr:hypothetical protein [Thioclava sp. ES.031]PFG63576.1 hypothetical protein AXZ77_2184 [Thioclava sp. ES.031]
MFKKNRKKIILIEGAGSITRPPALHPNIDSKELRSFEKRSPTNIFLFESIRYAFALASILLITALPSAAEVCTVEDYSQFEYQEPIPLGNKPIQSVISNYLGCEVDLSNKVNFYSEKGVNLGEVKGLLADPLVFEELGVRSDLYWIISEANTGEEVATPADSVDILFGAPDNIALVAKAESVPLISYNPAAQGTEPRVVGPVSNELSPTLRNQMFLAAINASAGLNGDPLQEITFRSEPSAASLWFGSSFKGKTEKRFGIARSKLKSVRMTLDGYKECNSSNYKREDNGYNVATIICEMTKQ